MHISESILSILALIAGSGLSFGGVAYGLRQPVHKQAAAFFMASLIHVPIPPTQAHLVLNGLLGLLLRAEQLAIMVALSLQALLFQFGGITSLDVNTFIMVFPAVICELLLHPLLNRGKQMHWVEALITGLIMDFLGRVKPGLLSHRMLNKS
jgi:cobalt/nickel transport system permease protein